MKHTSPGRSLHLLRIEPFPKYGLPLHKYFDRVSVKSQNLIPNLSGLLAIYYMKDIWFCMGKVVHQ